MDHSEFDLLEKAIEKALTHISDLQSENARLKADRGVLADQLKSEKNRFASISNRIVQSASPSPDRVAELKLRLLKLIETIREFEKST